MKKRVDDPGFVVYFYHMKNTAFGELVKQIRSEKRIGLREFCIACDCDPSNWSKIERGILSPPKDKDALSKVASALGVAENSNDWKKLFDYASISAGRIPEYVLQEPELLKKLPIFFRTMTGKKPTRKDLTKLLDILRAA